MHGCSRSDKIRREGLGLGAAIIRKCVSSGSVDIVEVVGDFGATTVGDGEVCLLDKVGRVVESEVGDIDDGRCVDGSESVDLTTSLLNHRGQVAVGSLAIVEGGRMASGAKDATDSVRVKVRASLLHECDNTSNERSSHRSAGQNSVAALLKRKGR